ncbi:ribonuclease H2, subunit C [Cladorrhinum samala]|uniref:Ribonuclease H2, subunit C n=1 Tax=Cladorrhinum samala TaxID=585594 RepID=A0AAV9HGL3_9PEZI|nr:ribonuclease H2, subunit C [Cladorrhinum samala]
MPSQILNLKPSSSSDSTSSSSTTPEKVTANLLPCRINHSGPIGPVPCSFWNPETSEDNKNNVNKNKKSTAYFRGRKLNGRSVQLPSGYKGVVASIGSEEPVVAPGRPEEEHDTVIIDLEKEEEGGGGTLQVSEEFDELMIWGIQGGGGGGSSVGEQDDDDGNDVYVRGVEEWIKLAGGIHSFER